MFFFFFQLHILRDQELPAHLLPVSTRLHAQIHTQLFITGLTDCAKLKIKVKIPVLHPNSIHGDFLLMLWLIGISHSNQCQAVPKFAFQSSTLLLSFLQDYITKESEKQEL